MVFLIAAIPALFVYWISVKTNSYSWTAVAGILAGAVGISTGNPTFVGVDLMCIAIAFYISHVQIKERRNESTRQETIQADAERVRLTNERNAAIRIAQVEAIKKARAQKRTELRKEQQDYERAANDLSLRESARARAASKAAEIEDMIQQKYPD